jgi:hypothetical protein
MNHRTLFNLALLSLVAVVTMAAGGFRDPSFVAGMTPKPVAGAATTQIAFDTGNIVWHPYDGVAYKTNTVTLSSQPLQYAVAAFINRGDSAAQPSGATFGGSAMSLINTGTQTDGTRTYTYGLALGSSVSGAKNCVVTLNGDIAANSYSGVAVFYNVNQSTPYGTIVEATSSAGTSSSQNVTCDAKGMAVDFVYKDSPDPGTLGAGQTEIAAWTQRVGGSYEASPSGGTVAMSWTDLSGFNHTVVPLKP